MGAAPENAESFFAIRINGRSYIRLESIGTTFLVFINYGKEIS